jgi:hypothetical protein
VFDSADLISMLVFLVVFIGTNAGVLLLFARLDRDNRRTLSRLRDLGPSPGVLTETGVGDLALSALPKVGALLMPLREKERVPLQARLQQAGFYGPQALRVFLGAKMLLLVLLPLLAGVVAFLAGWLSPRQSLLTGSAAAGVALIAPGLWLDSRRRKRQSALRRALPVSYRWLTRSWPAR